MEKKRKSKNRAQLILIVDVALLIVAAAGFVAFSAPSPVKNLRISYNTYNTACISWMKDNEADGYRIYRSEDGETYEYLSFTADNKYTDKGLVTGKDYYYAVTVRNGLKSSDVSESRTVKITPELDAPHVVANTSTGNIEISVSKVDGASAYEIIRDGEVIGQTKGNSYIDSSASVEAEHKYGAKAIRDTDGIVYSKTSNIATAILHTVPNIKFSTDSGNIIMEWDSSDYYDTYKVYNGEDLVSETEDTECIIPDFDTETIYEIKIVGYKSEDSFQSPETVKKIKVFEEPMDNEAARKAACDWGVMIAEDNSFAYGTGSRAHHCGCYFCGTNRARKGPGYEKTYCCNPFVHACYAHGAKDPQMLKTCQKGDSVGMNSSDYTRYGNWENIGLPSMEDLEPGDVFISSGHVMLYIGDEKIVHARNSGWGADTILVDSAPSYYKGFTKFVMRYNGVGSGTMFKVREVDGQGNAIIQDEEDSNSEDAAA